MNSTVSQSNRCAWIAVVALLATAGSAYGLPPGVRVVDPKATPGGTGLSWDSAYRSLQTALTDPGATEVWVIGNTCAVSETAGDVTATFTVSEGLAVYGGFEGSESLRDQRDWERHTSILSGWLPGGQRVHHVVTISADAGPTTILDGFTITGGLTAPSASQPGGAGLKLAGGPTIRNCTVRQNGLGIPDTSGMPLRGAGAYCAPGSNVLFENCTFLDNDGGRGYSSALAAVMGGLGGGLAAESCTLTLRNCVFRDNRAGAGFADSICSGGSASIASHGGSGGGVHLDQVLALIEDCVFTGNSAGNGAQPPTCGAQKPGSNGGHGGAVAQIGGSLRVINSLFVGNRAGDGGRGGSSSTTGAGANGGNGGSGGALSVDAGAIIVNSTFFGNIQGAAGPGGVGPFLPGSPGVAGTGSAVFASGASTIANAIIWDQSSPRIAGAATVRYSNVRGGFPGPGNIDADPMWVSPPTDFRLSAGSPAIDAGDTTFDTDPVAPGQQFPTADLRGAPRRLDDPMTADSGVGLPPLADMGAYEHDLAGPPITFDEHVLSGTASFVSADSYRSRGVLFDASVPVWNLWLADAGYAPLFFTGGGSSPNTMLLSNPFDPPGLTITAAFVLPGTSTPATTDWVQVVAGDAQVGSVMGTLEALDADGAVLASATAMTPPEQRGILRVEAAGIAGFRITTDGDGAVFDNIDFGPPAVLCRPDLNGDGLVDFGDYLEFLNLYEDHDPRVDFNQDGLVDFSDYLEFLNLYEAGC